MNEPVESTTAEVARRLGVPVSTVRFWVRSRLVSPSRVVNNTYLFGDTALAILRYIHRRRQEGAGLEEIRQEVAQGAHRKSTHPGTKPSYPAPAAEQPSSAQGMRVLCFANQKGGVGKTTSTVSVAAALARLGRRILLIDWDPQGNATRSLGFSEQEADEMMGVFHCVDDPSLALDAVVVPTSVSGLDLAPANIQLSGLEIELATRIGREFTLREIMQRSSLPYDYVLIDTPPTLGIITANALVASHEVVIPVQAEYLPLEGVRLLINTVTVVQRKLNPELHLRGVIITMYDESLQMDRLIRQRVESVFGRRVFQAIVPRTEDVAESQMYGQPLEVYRPDSPAATAYRQIAAMLAGLASDAV